MAHAVCRALGRRATALAPRFIADAYSIWVVPLAPDEWRNTKTRVAVRLVPNRAAAGSEAGFDISDVSNGIAIWTAYTVVEAARRFSEELGVVFREFVPPKLIRP